MHANLVHENDVNFCMLHAMCIICILLLCAYTNMLHMYSDMHVCIFIDSLLFCMHVSYGLYYKNMAIYTQLKLLSM